MSRKRKTPTEGGFRNRLQNWLRCGMLPTSKQFTVAETNQLYTISLKSRNKTALVYLRRLLGLLIAPYVQLKMALRLIGLCESGFDGFPQSVVTLVRGNVKARTVDYCQ